MNQKINNIIFSSDRASQLKLLLDSIKKNASEVFKTTVLFATSTDEYKDGYKKVILDKKYSDVIFIEIFDLKQQTIELLKCEEKFSCFFLDDDVIYNLINLKEIEDTIESDEDIVCFSLRLGENTTHCYTLGVNNVMHDIHVGDNIMKWDWSLHYLDFGYPFSLEGHVYRTKDILKLTKKCDFSDGFEGFEMSLFDFAENFPRIKMASYKNSSVVGIPVGRVQVSIDDEALILKKDGEARIKRKELNNELLKGNFINLELLDFSNIIGCHQEIKL